MRKFLSILILTVLVQFQLWGQCGAGETQVIFEVDPLGYAPSQVSWKLIEESTETEVFAREAGFLGSVIVQDTLCLSDNSTYRFEAYDEYGDGWNNNEYTIFYADGFVLRSGMPDNGESGEGQIQLEESYSFAVGERPGDDCSSPAMINVNETKSVNTALYSNAYTLDPLFDSGREAIFQFTPAVTDNYLIRLANIPSLDRGSIQLFDNCYDSNPTRISLDSTGVTNDTLEILEPLNEGTSYYIVVSNNLESGTGAIQGDLNISYSGDPINTTCADALNLTVDGAPVSSRLYSPTPSASALFSLTTIDSTVYEAFSGPLTYNFTLGSLQNIAIQIDGFDDFQTSYVELLKQETCADTAEVTYKRVIKEGSSRVFAFDGLNSGTYRLNIYLPNYAGTGDFQVRAKTFASMDTATNQNCASALAANVIPQNQSYNPSDIQWISYFNADDSGTGIPCGQDSIFTAGTSDVWVKALVPESKNLAIQTIGELYDVNNTGDGALETRFSVYSGACGSLTEVYCSDKFTNHQTDSVGNLSAGEEVFIRFWDRNGDDSGNIGVLLSEPGALSQPQLDIQQFSDSLAISFQFLGEGPIFDYNVKISADSFATFLPSYNPAVVSSNVGSIGVSGLDPATKYYIQVWSSKGNLTNSDTTVVQVETAPFYVNSIANGNWSDATTWEGGIVPPVDSAVNIYHKVSIKPGENFNTKSIRIDGSVSAEPKVGLWMNNGNLNVEKNVFVTTSSAQATDSVGIFITTDGTNSSLFDVGTDLVFEISDESAGDPLRFSAINNGDSLKVNIANEFRFSHNGTDYDSTRLYDEPNINFQSVDLAVGANLFLYDNSFNQDQPFNAIFNNSRINVGTFYLDAFQNTNGQYQVNFTGNNELIVNFDFKRRGNGGRIEFKDNSTLHLNGYHSQIITGFGEMQDSIIYNNLILNLRGEEHPEYGKPTVSLKSSYEELETKMIINGETTFINGFIEARRIYGSDYNVIFTETASTSDVNATSFIDGAVTKYGLVDFTFPIGQREGPRPVRVNDALGTMQAQDFIKINTINNFCGDSTSLLNEPVGFNNIRTEEYWKVEANLIDPNQTVEIEPYIIDMNKEGITNTSALELADFNSATSLGNISNTDSSFTATYDFNQGLVVRLGLANTTAGENAFYEKREITAISANSAIVGETVTLTYSSAFASTNDVVYFNGKPAPASAATANSVDVVVPQGARSGELIVDSENHGLIYPNFHFTVASSSDPTISAVNFQNKSLISTINGEIIQGENIMKLGQLDSDEVFDAMIVSPGYNNVTTVKSLSGLANVNEFQLVSNGSVLSPNFVEIGLSNIIGNTNYDAAFGVNSSGNDGLIYYQNDGDGNFFPLGDGSVNQSTSYLDVTFNDYTFDGEVDLAFSTLETTEVSYSNYLITDYDPSNCLPNDSLSNFNEPNGRPMDNILIADYDNDGNKDFVYLVDSESRFGLASLYNTNLPIFTNANSRGGGLIHDVVNISWSADGTTQFVATNQVSNALEYYSFDATSNEFIVTSNTVGFKPANLMAEDVNGDGFEDLIVNSQDAAELHFFINDGTGNFTNDFTVNVGGGIIASFEVVDLDNDGYRDLLILQENGELSVVYYEITDMEVPQPIVSNVNSNGFDINWAPTANASQYEVYVGRNTNLNSIGKHDSSFVVSNESLTYQVPQYSELYYYFVRAISSGGDTSSFSSQNSVKLPVSEYLVQDSLAMVSLYENGNGENWNKAQNWLTGKLNTWEGLSMVNDSLKAIHLPLNQIEGALPNEISDLNFINEIDLSGNKITDIVTLEPLIGNINSLNVSGNELNFEQLQAFGSILNFSYGNQNFNYTLPGEYFDFLEANVSMVVTAPAASNTFQWYKDSVRIEGETDSVLVFNNLQRADEGFYYVEVNNDVLGNLTISSTLTELKVSSLERDVAALREFYDSTNGNGWTSITWDTSSDNPADWSEDAQDIIVENNRVVEVNLSENNLTGSVPQVMDEVLGLRTFTLSNNAIENLPNLSALPNLSLLDVSGNALGYDDLEPNIAIEGLIFNDQANFGNLNDQKIAQGSGFSIEYEVAGSNNTYQWYLDNNPVEVSNTDVIKIDSISFETMGGYRLEVRNEIISAVDPEFTLESNLVEIIATANLSGFVADANDFPTESGQIHLFEYVEGQAFDSVLLDNNEFFENIKAEGVFEIQNIELGDYILYVDNNENEYPELLNTYFPNTIDWEFAEVISLRKSLQELEVTMAGEPQTLTGTSNFSGYLEEEVKEGERRLPRRRVRGAGVSVRTLTGSSRDITLKSTLQNGELVAYLETDENGEFEIPNLPAGRYSVKFDIPGVPMDEESDIIFDLTGEDQESLEVSAVYENGKITVNRVSYTANKSELLKNVKVYPNPSTGRFKVSGTEAISNIKLLSPEGKLIRELSSFINQSQEVEIDLSDYPDGMYFMQIKWKDGLLSMNKLIKD